MAGGLTPEVLLRRLVVAYDAENEEALAGKTTKSLRTLRRWKQIGFPNSAQALLGLLEEADLLRPTREAAADDESAARRLQRLGGAVAEMLQSQREMGEHLRDVQARLALAEEALSRGRSAPKHKRANR
jgi:ubiquinone biosynthesis protein COQ9